MPNYVPGVGSLAPRLMIVGEAPGAQEDAQKLPMVGPTGEIVNDLLFKCGVHRSEVYITNVVKFRPPMNDWDKLHLIGVDVKQSTEELWENEIKRLQPNCILAVGNKALNAICGVDGILNYRGSILSAVDGITKCIPTIHPAALFSRSTGEDENKGGLEWTWIKLIEADFQRAVDESLNPKIELPDRNLTVAHNSLDVHRFFREYEHLDKSAMDIESINCVPVCIGFAFTRQHAISIPLLRKIGPHYVTDMGDNEMDDIYKIVYEKLATLKLVGHNLKYDEFKLTLMGFGDRKFRTMNVYSDTLIKTRVIFPEMPKKRLNDVSSLWTREPYYKEEGKEFKLGKFKPEQLLLYNAKDCAVEIEVDEEQENDLIQLGNSYGVPLVDYYYNYMMKKHKFYLRMENVGFETDHARQLELRKKYTVMQAEVHARLVEQVGREINVKSYPDMFTLLYKEMKFKVLKRNPTAEESIVRLMSNHAKKKGQKEILTDVLEERRIRDQKSRYINFQPDYDGTCKTSYNISATETCRSSTSILKKPVRPKKIGLAFHTISAHGRLAKDIKSMLRPRKGKVFVKADASQAEARIVMVLAKQYDILEVIDKIDIHRRTAALILGMTRELDLRPVFIPVIDELGKDSPERFCGKKTRHAGNYQMGKGRFMLEFNTDAQKFEIDINISEWKAGEMIRLFREADSRLESNFWNDITEAIKSTRCLIDPYGGIRIFNGRMDDELFKEGYANIPQRTVSHLVQGAGLKIEEELNNDDDGYFIGEKHDELIMEVPENNWEPYAQLLKKYMEVPIDFSRYCSIKRDYILTIPCDVEISNTHYGDFQKVKLEKVA
jgi:DNA polymerase